MRVPFVKMQGLGNDFVVLDDREGRQQASEWPSKGTIRSLADRRRGVGCDQVLLIERPRRAGTDVYYRVFNADGHEVEQCGNGVRCLARRLKDLGGATDQFVLDSAGGAIHARVLDDGRVTVRMPEPDFSPASLPFEVPAQADLYTLDCPDGSIEIGAVSMGNPHAVVFVDAAADAPVAGLGRQIETHPQFPDGVNAGFCQVDDPGHVTLRVFERGVGETLACGTGACAAVAVARRLGKVADSVEVSLPGGTLVVSWRGPGEPLFMTGPAENVFEGTIDL